jgi:predicted DNA-binding transcriptional regulator YafY
MSTKTVIKRYHLIIGKLRRKPATFTEIIDYLKLEGETQEEDFIISKKTFRRDLDDIASIYDIDISYNPSQKKYYIEYEAINEPTARMMEAFDTFNALNISERLSDYIHFEKRVAKGTELLYGVLHSIKNKKKITFTHQKHWEAPTQRTVEPYGLKEFNNRWYILANDLIDNKIKTFGLDRITDFNITNTSFQYPTSFNVKEYFKHCFGIMSNNEIKPQEVILSFEPYQGKYIKDLPLHASQKLLIDDEDEVRVKLLIQITVDFEMEIMKFGQTVKVIEPQSLIETILDAHKKAINLY